MFVLPGCASGPAKPKVEVLESIGPFNYEMSIDDVQSTLNNKGQAVFKALYGKDSYVLLNYYFNYFNKSYVFAFKNFKLIAIIEEPVFIEAWDAALNSDDELGNLPFEQGLGKLYEELVSRKENIIYDDFVDIEISHRQWVQKSERSTSANVSGGLTMLALIPIVLPMAPVALMMAPMEKANQKLIESNRKVISSIHLGDSVAHVKELLGEKGLADPKSKKTAYEVFAHELIFGIRDGKVEWISSYQKYQMIQKLQQLQGFRW
ncbi:hypothetical protein [Mariprofundus ferrooxydans]|nr:hypothetical protein [Mariprofundus ferrooxydans]